MDEGLQAKHQHHRDRCRNQALLQCGCIARAHSSLRGSVEILGSIKCALALKFCGGAKTHKTSKTLKAFGEISSGVEVIQIINFFNESPKSKLRKLEKLKLIN